MAPYSQLDQATKDALNAYINRRWGQLYELEKEWGERALKYLFLTNSGGAIATLSFLGAAKELTGVGTKVALFLICAWSSVCGHRYRKDLSSHVRSA